MPEKDVRDRHAESGSTRPVQTVQERVHLQTANIQVEQSLSFIIQSMLMDMEASLPPLVDPSQICSHIDVETDSGGDKPDNQDVAIAIRSPHGRLALCILADGMGGIHGGYEAASAAVSGFIAGFASSVARSLDEPHGGSPQVNWTMSMEHGYEQARTSVYQETFGHSGTTFTAAFIVDGTLYGIHIGDSQCSVVNDGESNRLTQEDTLGADLTAEGYSGDALLVEAEKRAHRVLKDPFSVLTRYLGGIANEPQRFVRVLRPGDQILLVCDGIGKPLGEQWIGEVISDPDASVSPISALIRFAKAKVHPGNRDNLTGIYVAYTDRQSTPLSS
jgi:protein phosphatase